jgi:hypothetical protein
MGTHMWSGHCQVSRRGRRMSLELPHPPIPMTAKDSEFLQRRRPELFYPYLPTPFNTAAAAAATSTAITTAAGTANGRPMLMDALNSNGIASADLLSKSSGHADGQPLPASLRHFAQLAQRHLLLEKPPPPAERIESPEPLRIRSPSSLQKEPPPREGSDTVDVDDQDDKASSNIKRFSHEPWNWRLEGSKEKEGEGAEENGRLPVAAVEEEEKADEVATLADHQRPQQMAKAESVVA